MRYGSDYRTTPLATLRIVKDLVDEDIITEREAVLRVPYSQIQVRTFHFYIALILCFSHYDYNSHTTHMIP